MFLKRFLNNQNINLLKNNNLYKVLQVNQQFTYGFTALSTKNQDKLNKLQKKYQVMFKENKFYDCVNNIKEQIQLKQKFKVNPKEIIQDKMQLGQLYIDLRNIENAKKLYEEILTQEDLSKLPIMKAQLYQDLASSYYIDKQYEQSHKYYELAISEFDKVQEKEPSLQTSRLIAICLLNVAESLRQQEMYYQSIQEYEKSVEIFLYNIENYQLNIKKIKEDNLEAIKKSNLEINKEKDLQECQESLRDCLQKISFAYEQLSDLKTILQQDSLNELKEALEYASLGYGDTSTYLLPIISKLSNYFVDIKKQYTPALKLYNYAIEIIEKNGQDVQFSQIYQILLGQARLQSDMKLFQDALDTFTRLESYLSMSEGSDVEGISLMIKGHKGYLLIQQENYTEAYQELHTNNSILKEEAGDQTLDQQFAQVNPLLQGIFGVMLCQRAFLKLKQKKYQQSLEEAQFALSIVNDSNKGDCYSVMGQSFIFLNKKEEARQYLQQSIDIIIKERPEEAQQLQKKLNKLKQ